MNIGEVEEAKELVESETKKLLEENLPSCAADTATQQTARRPTMAVGEEKETEEYERYFEEEHSGERFGWFAVPEENHGLVFPNRESPYYNSSVGVCIEKALREASRRRRRRVFPRFTQSRERRGLRGEL
jgi:hypothetical protein